MELSAVLLTVVFCLVGGIIAYGADALGRTLGKKRLSVFRLRPRHTAAMITTGAGVMIPLLTVFVLYIFVSDVRTMLREGSVAARERDRLQGEAREMEAKLEQLDAQVATSAEDLEQAQSELATIGAERDELNSEAEGLRAEVGTLNSRVSDFQERVAESQKRLGELGKQIEDTRKELGETVALRDQAVDDNEEIKQRNLQLEQLNLRLEDSIGDLQGRLATLSSEVTQLTKDRDDLRAEYEKALAQGRDDLAAVRRDLDSANLELTSARAAIDQTKAQIESLQAEYAVMGGGFLTARYGELIVQREAELARRSIGGSLNLRQAQTELITLMRSARVFAESIGAQPMQGIPAAAFWPMFDQQRLISADEQASSVALATISRTEPSVLIARARWNAFRGESIPINVQILPNPVVYLQSDVIAEGRIDGRRSDEEVLGEIQAFFRETLAPTLQRAGMIPVAGSSAPFGAIEQDVILGVVAEIRSQGRVVRLQAIAAEETRAADRPRMFFRVR